MTEEEEYQAWKEEQEYQEWKMSQQPSAPTESEATSQLSLADKANKVAEEAMAKQVPVVEMLSNIPSTARAAAGDLKNMVMHPIETAKGVANLVQGGYQKFTPGIQDKEMYVDAVVNRMKDRYGGIDKINKTLRNDPAGAFLDVAPMASGAKIAKAAAKAPLKAVPQGAVNKLYESAAKFSTTKDQSKLIESALKNKINPSPIAKPNIKLKNMSNEMKSRVDGLIDEAAKKGNKVHKNIVFRDIGAVKKEFGSMNPTAKSDLAKIDAIVKEMDSQFDTYIPIKDLQKLKRRLNKDIKWDRRTGTLTPVKEATYRAMERGAREGVEALEPKVKGLNKQWGEILDLKDPIKQSSQRIANRDLFGLRVPLAVGAGGLLGGPYGAGTGLALAAADSPFLKASTAIGINAVKRQNLINEILKNTPGVMAGTVYQSEKLKQENE